MSESLRAQRNPWALVVAISIVGALLVSLVVLAFLWPSKTATPKDLPLAVSGPTQSVETLTAMLEQNAAGTFDLIEATDRDEAVAMIASRETYGAIILTTPPQAPEVLTTSAGSAAVSQMLSGLAGQLQAQLTAQVVAAGGDPSLATVTVTDVVPLSADDPSGAGLAAAAFPLTIGGLLGGVIVSLLVTGGIRRISTLAGFSALTGLALALVLHTWFGYLGGGFWLNVLTIGMSILATAAFVAGCSALLGRPGLGIAAVFTVLFANPLSAAGTPWQFLAEPWGAIGQFLTPGAANTLLRSVNYFPDAATAPQWLVLAAWAVAGMMLVTFASSRKSRPGSLSSPGSAEAPVGP